MTEIKKDPLVDAVSALTTETTKLLNEYKESKIVIDNKVTQAASYANSALDSQKAATSNALESTKSAASAKADADRAKEITGLNTVDAAVSDALMRSYQYAMTKAEFDLKRTIHKLNHAGSGYLYKDKKTDISTLLQEDIEMPMLIDGNVIYLNLYKTEFPNAECGTKTYNVDTRKIIDHTVSRNKKYPNEPVALTKNEAISRAFEGILKNGDLRLGDDGSWNRNGGEITSEGLIFDKDVNSYTVFNQVINESGIFNVEFTIKNWESGSVRVVIQGDNTQYIYSDAKGNGRYTFTTNAIVNARNIMFERLGSNHKFIVNNISLQKTTESVVLSRSDFVFIESWYELLSEKDIIVPRGDVNFKKTKWNDVELTLSTELGVAQGYSALGAWDKKTEGHFARASELTKTQIQSFINDPKNNIYFDDESSELVQFRFRCRIIPGPNNSPAIVTPAQNNQVDAMTWSSKELRIARQENKTISKDFNEHSFFYSAGDEKEDHTIYKATGNLKRLSVAMPLALIQRLNEGATHPVLNKNGCKLFLLNNIEKKWYELASSNIATQDCFKFASDSESSGREDNILCDVIYDRLIHELYLDAKGNKTYQLDALSRNEIRGIGHSVSTTFDIEKEVFYDDKIKTHLDSSIAIKILPENGINKFGKCEFYELSSLNEKVLLETYNTECDQFGLDILFERDNEEFIFFNVRERDLKINEIKEKFKKGEKIKIRAVRTTNDTTAFNVIPCIDIIGDLENINIILRNGISARYIKASDNSKYTLNYPSKSDSVIILESKDGMEWKKTSVAVDKETNTITKIMNDSKVALIYYDADAEFSIISNNLIINELGRVFVSSHYMSSNVSKSLVNDILTAKPISNNKNLLCLDYQVNFDLTTSDLHHVDVQQEIFAGKNAIKVMTSFIEKNGLIYLQFNGQEMKCTNDWGDDSRITMLSGEGTKEDLNANIVKTFCHHSKFPVGISNHYSKEFIKKTLVPFVSFDDVPIEIKEFYHEENVIVSYDISYEERQEDDHIYQYEIKTPIYEPKLFKKAAYYENKGHSSKETIKKWSFHDDYIRNMILS